MTKLSSFLIFLISFSGFRSSIMILISFCFDVQKIVSRASNVCMKFIFLGISFSFPSIKNKTKLYYSNLIQLICPVYSQALFLGQWDSLSRGGGGTQQMVFNDHFSRKRYPFRIPSIGKWCPPFHKSCLELCIPFNCCNCTVF